MSTCEGLLTTLAHLPFDVIRQLIRLRPIEDIDSLRIISPRWHALCHENLIRNRKHLPKIDEMILDFEAFSNELIWLRFECPERYANYLGLNDSQVISKNNGVHKVDCIINYDEKLVRRLKRFFGRISHIPRLELVFENSSSKPALEFMKIAMRGMIIDTSSIFNFIRGDTVCCLIIDDVSAIGQGQSSPFFVELLRLIESVEIFAETAEYEDWMKLRDGFHPC